MVEERLQTLLNNIKEQCPNIGPVPCFVDENRAILQIHFRYDSEPLPDAGAEQSEGTEGKEHSDCDKWDEYDDECYDPLDHGYNHMFMHALDLKEADWSVHEKDILDKYNRIMERN